MKNIIVRTRKVYIFPALFIVGLLLFTLNGVFAAPIQMLSPWEKGTGWKSNGSYYGEDLHVGPDYHAVDFNGVWDADGNRITTDDCNKAILAVDDGTVSFADLSGGYGYTVKITHLNNTLTRYAHLNSISVSELQSVKRGDLVGYSGNTGGEYTCHLHFVLYQNGTSENVEPSPLDGQPMEKDQLFFSSNTSTATTTMWGFDDVGLSGRNTVQSWKIPLDGPNGGEDLGVIQSGVDDGKWKLDPKLDPQLISPNLEIPSSQYPTVELRFSAQGTGQTDHCEVFFSKTSPPSFNANDVVDCSQSVIRDGTQRSYTVNLASNSNYTGQITAIRIDPIVDGDPNSSTDLIYIDSIEFFPPQNPIYIFGVISQNTTWFSNQVYVIQGGVSISPGVTLTIEPGTVVKFQDGSFLDVNGTLSARGTSHGKIYFTSFYDDSVGGDTDGDPWRSPQAGDWQYIRFSSSSTGNELNNTVIRYVGNYYGYGVYNNGGAISISNSEIAYNQSRGLYLDSGTVAVTGTNFHDNSTHGIYAAAWSGQTTLTLNNNTFATTDNSVAAEIDASVDFSHTNNTSTGTGWNGFKMFGFMSSNRRWTADTMPYISYGVSISPLTTLTLDPGVIVKMQGMDVQGTLQANGTPQNKIYFTSICDDEIGGDTNGRSCFDWEYYWGYIWLSYYSTGNLSNAVFRYGGWNGWGDEWPAILADTADLTLTDSVFTYNAGPPARLNNPINFTHSGNSASNNAKNGFEIYGRIDNNQIWNDDLPYIIKDIDVWGNLTLDSGVIMKFNHSEYDNYDGLTVNGILNATGNATSTVFFTSIKDDELEVGGDTNGDGSATTPAPADWKPIKFTYGSQGNISYLTSRYGGMNDWSVQCYGGTPGWCNNGGTLTISHSKLEKNSNPWDGIGLTQTEGVLTINDSEFNEQRLGISIQGGSAAISQSKFQNQNWGLVASGSTALTLTDSTFNNNSIAAALIYGSVNFSHSGNFVPDTSTGLKGFAMTGWISQDRTWTSGDLPYIIRDNDNVTVDYGSTLTVQPGAVVKFGNSYAPLSVNGILFAQGTPTSTISFTSLKDDLIGGDTNGDGYSSGSPNDWDAISFYIGSQGNFSNSIIRYGGAYNNGAISTNYGGGTIHISNSQIDRNGTYGIYHANGSLNVTGTEIHDHSYGLYSSGGTIPALSQNHFYNNSMYGLYNATTSAITAENNYWSSPSGPYHPTLNPNGTGNPVSDYVDFEPWLTSWP